MLSILGKKNQKRALDRRRGGKKTHVRDLMQFLARAHLSLQFLLHKNDVLSLKKVEKGDKTAKQNKKQAKSLRVGTTAKRAVLVVSVYSCRRFPPWNTSARFSTRRKRDGRLFLSFLSCFLFLGRPTDKYFHKTRRICDGNCLIFHLLFSLVFLLLFVLLMSRTIFSWERGGRKH